jgi:hypothetical protein
LNGLKNNLKKIKIRKMSEQQEQRISFVLKNFIEEISKDLKLTEEQKTELKKMAIEDTNKLFNYSLEIK